MRLWFFYVVPTVIFKSSGAFVLDKIILDLPVIQNNVFMKFLVGKCFYLGQSKSSEGGTLFPQREV
jgi:hypothetical protein